MAESTLIESTPKTKKKGKKALKILGIILSVIVLLTAVLSIISAIGNSKNYKLANSFEQVQYENQLIPEKDENGYWTFTADRDLKIVQITDVHIGGGFLSTEKDACALTAVATMLTEEKPDLVVVTGDVAYPVPFQAGTFNNKTGAKMFAQLMESLGIYWTLCFGNHDTEAYSFYSREDISDFYTESGYKYCLFQEGPEDIDGFGNQIIELKNTAGKITQALFIFDSHSYTDGDYFGIQWKYDNIHENQVEWYKTELSKLAEQNNTDTVSSLAFFHIPLVEYKDAWDEFEANGYKDTEDVKYIEGIIGESKKGIYCGIGEDSLFETMLELGSTKAMFCGHDHFNNITLNYKGITLSYGNSIDYLAYIGINKQGSQRGCTVITSKENSDITIEKFNLYSGRYTLPEGFDEDISFQFEDVTFRNITE